MSYPRDLAGVRQAIMNHVPAAAYEEQYHAAQMIRAPVVMVTTVFSVLKREPSLDQEALALLLGTAHLISVFGWGEELPAEAALILSTRSIQMQEMQNAQLETIGPIRSEAAVSASGSGESGDESQSDLSPGVHGDRGDPN